MQIYSITCPVIKNEDYKTKEKQANIFARLPLEQDTYQNQKITFGSKPQKKLIEFLATQNLGKFKITFDEAKRMCEFLGHKVILDGGSHAKVHIKDNKGIIILVIPHGSESNISILDKKRLLYLFTGRYNDAFRVK